MRHARRLGAFILIAAILGASPALAQTPAPESASASAAAFTDAQLQTFIAARDDVRALQPGQTAEEQRQVQIRISEMLRARGITPEQYRAIADRLPEDAALRNRVALLSVGPITDAEIQAFAAASLEIDPISRTLATATPEQRAAASAQIRAVLDRYELDLQTYNVIARQAQADPAIAARVAALQAPPTMGAEASAQD